MYIIHQGREVHDYTQSAKIRSRGAQRDVRREGHKGLLYSNSRLFQIRTIYENLTF
jgi:hypothetical protein